MLYIKNHILENCIENTFNTQLVDICMEDFSIDCRIFTLLFLKYGG